MNAPADVHAYRRTTRRAMLGLNALVGLLFIGAIVALVFIARHEDQHQLRHSEADANRAVNASVETLSRAAKDYAIWDDGYRHLGGPSVDLHWALEDNNLGPAMTNTYSLDGVFVVNDQGATLYGLVHSLPRPLPLGRLVSGDLAPLLAAAREGAAQGDVAQGFFLVAGQPAIVHAAAIRPQLMPTDRSAQSLSVLVFVYVLDPTRLQRLADDYELDGLVAELGDEPAQTQASLLAKADYGSTLRLRWYAEAPGDVFLRTLLPLLALIFALCTVVAVYFYRSALRTAEMIDQWREQGLQARARYRAVAEAASDWIWETDAQGWLTYLCERFEPATGFAAEQWLGRPLVTLLEYNHPLFASNALADAPGRWRQVPCRLRDASGHWHDCQLTVRAVLEGNALVGYRGSVLDLSGALGSSTV
ncbi:CHASE4 domain-containing protein [Pseudomonas sp. NPDC007930]|uniref:CHASE4 domain-containing protein n=1 Tax=Pseudomonas sp. NPDC007930 TaxID=3364417 RepID=UPI0036F0757B